MKEQLDYREAKLHTTKRWYIDYYVRDPQTRKMVRKFERLNRIEKLSDRRAYAVRRISEINKKLKAGWHPEKTEENQKGSTPINEVFGKFLANKAKKRSEDTMRAYHSFFRVMEEFFLDSFTGLGATKHIPINEFNNELAGQYLDYIYIGRENSLRTHNNHLIFFKSFWNWCILYGYATTSPFKGFKEETTPAKKRRPLEPEHRQLLNETLPKENLGFYICCLLAFSALIRRTELTKIKVGQVNLRVGLINMNQEITKNRKERISTLTRPITIWLAQYLADTGAANSDYLIGKGFKPGPERIAPKKISDTWAKLRKKIDLPQDVQFYSLRDTGIIQMLNDGIAPQEVMKQADHSSLSITTIYARHINPQGSSQIRDRSSSL